MLAGTDAADELRARLKVEKTRKAALAAELEALKKGRGTAADLDDKRLVQALRSRVRDRTRQILKKLLVGRLECRAFEEDDRIGYRFIGRGFLTELLPVDASTLVVTPAGFEPAISTLKGSRPRPG